MGLGLRAARQRRGHPAGSTAETRPPPHAIRCCGLSEEAGTESEHRVDYRWTTWCVWRRRRSASSRRRRRRRGRQPQRAPAASSVRCFASPWTAACPRSASTRGRARAWWGQGSWSAWTTGRATRASPTDTWCRSWGGSGTWAPSVPPSSLSTRCASHTVTRKSLYARRRTQMRERHRECGRTQNGPERARRRTHIPLRPALPSR
jgi:hypothetical protein